MSVQTELTRISTAKTNIKNVVNSNTANTISNQKLDAFPPLINGTIAVQKSYIPWIKGEGNDFILKNSKSGELDEFEIYGNTEQNQYSGKNLFNIDAVTSVANGSINANKIIVTNAGTSTNFNVAPVFPQQILYSGKTYYLSADIRRVSGEGTFGKMNDYVADWTAVTTPTLSTSYQRYTYKKTFSSDVNYYRILIQFRNTNNGIFEIKNIQISEVDNVYEPYCGGVAAPNPDYPQEVRVVENEQIVNVHGKNLFDKNNANIVHKQAISNSNIRSNNHYISIYIPAKEGKTYTISSDSNLLDQYASLYFTSEDLNTAATHLLRVIRTPETATSITATAPIGAKYVCAYIMYSTNEANINSLLSTIQLEENSTATEYEAYKEQNYTINLGDIELCKIGDYKDSIKKSTGKNLFDGGWSNGSIGSNGQNISDSKSIRTTGIGVKSGVQYTFSSSTTTSINEFWINYYNGDAFVSREYFSSGNTQTFIVPSGVNIARFRLTATTDINTNIINNVQLEQNSQATEYEPYGEQWYIKKEIGKVVLDGTLSQYIYTNNCYQTTIKCPSDIGNREVGAYCDYFKFAYYSSSLTSNIKNGEFAWNGTFYLTFKNTDFTSAAEYNNWFAQTKPTIYYPLATPTYETITNSTLISQLNAIETFEGINNISIENENNVLPDLLMITKNKDSYNNWKTKEGLN